MRLYFIYFDILLKVQYQLMLLIQLLYAATFFWDWIHAENMSDLSLCSLSAILVLDIMQ